MYVIVNGFVQSPQPYLAILDSTCSKEIRVLTEAIKYLSGHPIARLRSSVKSHRQALIRYEIR